MKRNILTVFLAIVVLLTSYNIACGKEIDDKSQISAIKLAIDKSFEDSKGELEADKQNWGAIRNRVLR